MSDKTFDMAMDNAKKLGQCLGAMWWAIRYGELNDSDWKSLSRTYVNVIGELDEYHKSDITWIREEVVRRGVDIGG